MQISKIFQTLQEDYLRVRIEHSHALAEKCCLAFQVALQPLGSQSRHAEPGLVDDQFHA